MARFHGLLTLFATWRRIDSGLPEGGMGRIALAAAPSDPSIVHAIVEAAPDGSSRRRWKC